MGAELFVHRRPLVNKVLVSINIIKLE